MPGWNGGVAPEWATSESPQITWVCIQRKGTELRAARIQFQGFSTKFFWEVCLLGCELMTQTLPWHCLPMWDRTGAPWDFSSWREGHLSCPVNDKTSVSTFGILQSLITIFNFHFQSFIHSKKNIITLISQPQINKIAVKFWEAQQELT